MIERQQVGTERGKVMSWSRREAIFHIWRLTRGDGILGVPVGKTSVSDKYKEVEVWDTQEQISGCLKEILVMWERGGVPGKMSENQHM